MSTDKRTLTPAPTGRSLIVLAIASLGVVFGDLGTSPLYALHDTFVGTHPVAVTHDNVLGVLSLFLWSLIIVVSIKYLTIMMRADNRGEGGIFALLALTGMTRLLRQSRKRTDTRRLRIAPVVLSLGIAGAALLYGDAMITPAISVLSAVEGLGVATTALQPYVVPLTVVVIVALFAVQPFGSGRLGAVFGPVLALWFLVIAAIGVRGIAQTPSVVLAFDPRHAVAFFAIHGWKGYPVLGAVVLCLTGGEALYADMGHFGRRPIRFAWFTLAFPALVLSYLGQGAVLLRTPAAAENPFFRTAPEWSLYPLVALATAATVIASQGLISAVFSLTSQAVQLGLSPRLRVVHTSSAEIGQIYLPALNWVLMLACVALVVAFRSSTRLAAAFGLAVSGTMAITTLLFAVVARYRWRWGAVRLTAVAGSLLAIDLAFFGANLLKLFAGGWIPLVVGAVVFILLSTWWRGRALLREAQEVFADSTSGAESIIQAVRRGSAARVRGTAAYLDPLPGGVPRTLLHNLKHNKVVHECVLFVSVLSTEMPYVEQAKRVEVTPLGEGFWRIVAHYGFKEEPNVPDVLRCAQLAGVTLDTSDTTYFLGRVTIISAPKRGMARWREHLFGVMMRNTPSPTVYFDLPPNRVVELGTLVEI